ncbi:hypothetical protein CN933_29770 [Sinorhizobium sp. M4_45]|nr:hypothetical protein CN933_29770 [Sinorhizobium sp. M4_45]
MTAQDFRAAAKGRVNESNLASMLVALDKYGDCFGMDRPHRLAQYLAQLMHESGDFRYDREIWGPTPAQQRYDTRTDLGNPPGKDGDGYLYRGRTGMQLTPSVIGGGASLLTVIGGIPWQNLLLILVAFGAIAGFLYWRKNADRKAVARVEGMA